MNLSEAVQQRPWIDTMRTWRKLGKGAVGEGGSLKLFTMSEYPPIPAGVQVGSAINLNPTARARRLRSWAYEQYGSGTEYHGWPTVDSDIREFGVNRGREAGRHMYQRLYSGTYGTIDELAIYDFSPDPRTDKGLLWPYKMRSVGRYYLWKNRPGEEKPWFLSQNLFDSERTQSFAFATEEEETDVIVELGTVRWTVFTPFYCLDIPSEHPLDKTASEWVFPYEKYFWDIEGQDGPMPFSRKQVTQMWRHRPEHWEMAPDASRIESYKRSRISSQRGCRVRLVIGANDLGEGGVDYPSGGRYYDDPEAWQPILEYETGAEFSGRHLKAAPGDIRYRVFFELSQEENKATLTHPDAAMVDSPVFDDITVTYMRRPKVLEWRD
jgi:hypothetical protein